MADIFEAIGHNVRRLRESQGLSLSALASRSQVAKGTLFRMEHGGGNPTIETIVAIANALRVPVEEIFKNDPDELITVVRKGEGRDVSDSTAGGEVVHAAFVGPSSLDIQTLTFRKGTEANSPGHGAGAREYVYVLSGEIEVGIEPNLAQLHAGDFATYRADGAHKWRAISETADVLLINTAHSEAARYFD